MTQKTIATLISRLLDPFVVLTVATGIAGYHFGLTGVRLLSFFLVLLVMLGIPSVLLYWAIQKRKITNWDISRREERMFPFLILFGLLCGYLLLILVFGLPALTHLFVVYIIWMVGFFLITTRWKISGHSGVNALATGVIVSMLGLSWWPILFVVPLVAWARVVRHDHTLAQVIAGALYSWIIIVVSRIMFHVP